MKDRATLYRRLTNVTMILGTGCAMYVVPAVTARLTHALLLGKVELWWAGLSLLFPVIMLLVYLRGFWRLPW